MTVAAIQSALKEVASKQDAAFLQRYFKTGPGEYGEGDRFIGVRVPVLRKLSKQYRGLSLPECKRLLQSPVHEERLLALLILVLRFQKEDDIEKDKIYRLYINNIRFINNWDLIDGSAPHIVGAWLWDKDRTPLYKLAHSPKLWRRRVAIMSTHYFISQHDFIDALKIAEILLNDRHDLIHKAVGWMLREVGNRDRAIEEQYLKEHYQIMPRTMLRYAIEKFPDTKRKRYLTGTV